MDKLWRKRKPPVPLDWDSIQKGEKKCMPIIKKNQTQLVEFSFFPKKYWEVSVTFGIIKTGVDSISSG